MIGEGVSTRCTHKLHELPRWLSANKVEIIKEMLAEDPAMFLRETMGISAESTQRAFQEEHVARFEKSAVALESDVKSIFVSIDPSGGGNCSTPSARSRALKTVRSR